MNKRKAIEGFTVVELLVSIALSGVIMASIYSSFSSQQKAYTAQEQIAAMQQNLRAALYIMEREIRMAGYDPVGGSGASIVTADATSIRIRRDLTDNAGTGGPDGDTADVGEDVTYALYDADGDGDLDLGRTDAAGGGTQPMAENIDALNFVYLDENGTVTATPAQVRSVQITVVARAGAPDTGYVNHEVYTNQQGQTVFTPPPSDHFRRRMLTTEVKCRNLGLE
jgi:type IV pilus assembly protein PilW